MKTEVRIAQFKSRLSHYLRSVQRGNEVIVKDRDTPIARVVPFRPTKKTLISIPPTKSLKDIDKLFNALPKTTKVRPEDLEEALRWTRRDRTDDL